MVTGDGVAQAERIPKLHNIEANQSILNPFSPTNVKDALANDRAFFYFLLDDHSRSLAVCTTSKRDLVRLALDRS